MVGIQHPGYIPDGYDGADPRYVYLGEPTHKNDMQVANLLKTVPEAFKTDQPLTGSCVVDLVTAATRFLALCSSHGRLPARPSRRFLYFNARALALMDREGGDPTMWPDAVEDKGVRIRHAARAVSIFGAAAEDIWSWEEQQTLKNGESRVVVGINDRPPHAVYHIAGAGPYIECNRVDANPHPSNLEGLGGDELKAFGLVTLSGVKKCLIEGYPVIFAFHLFWPMFQSVPPSTAGGDEGYPTIAMIPAECRLAGPDPTKGFRTHAALIVGLDDQKRRVLVKSLEGQPSSPPPCFWMSYEWITDVRATIDFWMLRESSKSARRAMKVPGASDLLNLPGQQLIPISSNSFAMACRRAARFLCLEHSMPESVNSLHGHVCLHEPEATNSSHSSNLRVGINSAFGMTSIFISIPKINERVPLVPSWKISLHT
ncbi:hypothetical protein F4777DRAFT_385397 [Nemania sp. FL0916]|nr:hypothetical protein F4777DRAFT_385397 [Nemania sp. FL0916]